MSRSGSPEQEDSEPRRGSRVRKVVDKFDASQGKRKAPVREDDEHSDPESGSEEEEDSDSAPKKSKTKSQPKPRAKPKKAAAAGADGAPKKRARKSKGAAGAASEPKEGEGSKTDSPLFNALLQPNIALQPLIDDLIQTYQSSTDDQTTQQTTHDLITLIIRSCGLSYDLELAEAVDDDGIPDVVERIQDESLRVEMDGGYPLIWKGKAGKTFRANLKDFVERLIESLALTPILYETVDSTPYQSLLLPLLLNWLMCMSSSPLRPIRHTSTYITLLINTSLCSVANGVSKDLSVKQRQKDAEVRKAAQGAAGKKRLKEAEKRSEEGAERKERLQEFMQEIFDVMFVHRVRDLDHHIRASCVSSLGAWASSYPEYYLSPSYLTYFQRGCNDPNSQVRLETVKALSTIYGHREGGWVERARTGTMRLAERVVEMAVCDVEAHVRVGAVKVITLIDKTGILQDEDDALRDRIAKLTFDSSPSIRKAVGPFVVGLWEERKEGLKAVWSSLRAAKKKRAGKVSEEKLAEWLGWKALAFLLIYTSQSLADDKAADDDDAPAVQSALPPASVFTGVSTPLTRAQAALESISAEMPVYTEWQTLLDYLLVDHSTSEEDMWLLTEEEESFLIQFLIASLSLASTTDDGEEDKEDRTKVLINALPRLIAKHQGGDDTGRMSAVLSVVGHMKLGLYLDMRMSAAYEGLWDDITKQFLQTSSPDLLSASLRALFLLLSTSSLSTQNDSKITELYDKLFGQMRDFIGKEDVALVALGEEEVEGLQGVLGRVAGLMKGWDMTDVLEEGEDGDAEGEGKESSVWGIVCALAERGKLGHKEEAAMVSSALEIMFLHLTWLFKGYVSDVNDDSKKNTLTARRDTALDIFKVLTLGDTTNTVDSVRHQAFIGFLHTYVLFKPRPLQGQNGSGKEAITEIELKMEDEIQHRLGGAFQGALDRYTSILEFNASIAANVNGSDVGTPLPQSQAKVQEELTQSLPFLQLISTFIAAIRIGVLEVEHAKEPLAHYGRFSSSGAGVAYDAVVRKLVDVLRDEGIYNSEGETVRFVSGAALQQSFDIFLDTDTADPTSTISLAKLLSAAFTIHGSQFTVLRQLHPSDACDFHLESLDYLSRKLSIVVKQETSARNKEQKTRYQKKRGAILTFFKVLILLLGPVQPKDALKIKTKLDEIPGQSSLQVTSHKVWDGYRAYEKRLVGIASKDPGLKAQAKAAATKKGKGAEKETEETTEVDDEEEIDDDEPAAAGEGQAGEGDEIDRETTPTPSTRPQGRMRSYTISQPSPLSSQNTPPRRASKHPREESLDLDLDVEQEPSGEGEDAGEMDLDLDLDVEESNQTEEEKEEPATKKRKTRRG